MLRVLLLGLLCTRPAFADAVQVSLDAKVMLGKGLPSLSVKIQEPIAGFRVRLARSDGKIVDVRGGGKPGQTRVVQLEQPEGKFGYKGELTVRLKDGSEASLPLAFEAELLGPLRIAVEKKDVDLEGRKVRFTLSRAAGKAQVLVLMDSGVRALDEEVTFAGEAAGTPLEIAWPAAEGRVLKIAIQAHDTSGFFTGVELFPWRVDIPHEEVNFDTGKWEIRADQRARLDQSYALIADAVAKYGRLAAIKLYVAGHTDTVGDPAQNRALSVNRAKSIGAYFRKKGLRAPILHEGFGEEAPLVRTADETAEERNRRAEYIIAVESPQVTGAPFEPSWRRL